MRKTDRTCAKNIPHSALFFKAPDTQERKGNRREGRGRAEKSVEEEEEEGEEEKE